MKNDALPGVTIELHDLHGVAFPEYSEDVDVDVPYTTTVKHVEVSSGVNFIVDVKIDASAFYGRDSFAFKVFLDGTDTFHRIVGPQDVAKHLRLEGAYTQVRGKWTMQRYCFATLDKNENAPDTAQILAGWAAGEVKIEVRRCVDLGSKKSGSYSYHHAESALARGIPEEALQGKTLSKYATLGKTEKCEPLNRCRVTYPYGKVPIATYMFKYGTRDDIQARGVISRPPSPVPLGDRDPSTPTHEEAMEVVCGLQERRGRELDGVKIKQATESNRSQDSGVLTEDDDSDELITVETPRANKRRRVGGDA